MDKDYTLKLLKQKQTFAISLCLILFACGGNVIKTKETLAGNTDSIKNSDSISLSIRNAMDIKNFVVNSKDISSDFLIINESCGLFIIPDSMEANKMKQEFGEESFYVSVNDNSYYNSVAMTYLDRMHVRTLRPNNRYLKFVVKKDTICVDTKSKCKRGWLNILYKQNTMPKTFEAPDIEQEYTDYLE